MPIRTLGWLALLAAFAAAQQTPFEQKYEETQKLLHRHWEQKEYAKAVPLLDELRRDPRLLQFPEYRANVFYNLACAYSRVGDKARAVEMLKESARAGMSNFKHAESDKDLDNIRSEPGYKEALDRMRALAAFWDGPPIASGFKEQLTEEEKIAGLSKFWAEVKYNFAWFENVPDLNWDALYVGYLPKAREAKTTLDYYRLLRELCARLKDAHTYITPPREIREQLDFKPPLRTGLIEGKVLVVEVLDPALERDGVRRGLEILEVDGVPVHEHARRNVAPYQSASTPQSLESMTYDTGLLAGARGGAARVVFADQDGKRFERVLVRDRNRYAGAAALFEFRVLPGNVGYAELNSFNNEKIVSEFEAAYEQIEKTDALILDLRANPGGNEGNGRRILAYFFDRPFQTSIRGTRRNRAYYRAQGQAMDWHVWPQQMLQPHGKKFYSKPIVALTSARTGSAAEDFLTSLEIERRAVIVGEPTGGSTGQPLFISLPGGGSAGICTSASWYPDGRTFVGTGIQPNIRARPTVADARSGRDAALEAALKHLREAGASPGPPGGRR